MTTTSGPGISLMSEFIGLGYYAEIPAVIVDVQRVGPSTGLPTRTMQGDILSTYFLSHGDAKHILLIPGSVEECYSLAMDAFDLAERFQTPVFLMSDLDLGMNNWMADPFPYPDQPARPRQGPQDEGGARGARREVQGVRALPRRGRRRHSVAHAPGLHRHPRRRVLHARVRTQRARPLHGAAGRLHATTWTASPASSRPRAASSRARSSRTAPDRAWA